jgi:hypothetical protein
MKNSKIFKTVTILMIVLFAAALNAQPHDTKNIPETVVAALKQKYPTAELKGWNVNDDVYTAKIRLDGKKYFTAFNKNGDWINTVSKISWTWDLPKPVNEGFKNSQYRSWNIYDIHQITKPSGVFYQLTVNNANFTEISHSEGHFATERQIEFNVNGALTSTRELTYDAIDGH